MLEYLRGVNLYLLVIVAVFRPGEDTAVLSILHDSYVFQPQVFLEEINHGFQLDSHWYATKCYVKS